jgi:hypothetical protein
MIVSVPSRVLSLLVASACALCVWASWAPEARADSDLITRVDFLGWSGINPDAFCVRVTDAQKGSTLEVRQIGVPTPVLRVAVSPETESQVFAGAQFAPWSCIVPGAPGIKAPNNWQVFGQPEGGLLRIGVSNGKGSIQIGLVQARLDAVRNAPAKAALRTAYWSPDSMRVVVIVNHLVKGGAWGMDLDEPHGFKIGP